MIKKWKAKRTQRKLDTLMREMASIDTYIEYVFLERYV